MDERIRETIKQRYKETTDQLFLLREAFKESGFTDEESFKLTESYVRQTICDNIIRNESAHVASKNAVLKRYSQIQREREREKGEHK